MQSSLDQYFPTTKAGVARPAPDEEHTCGAVANIAVEVYKPNPFDNLPIEINQRVAELLEDDHTIDAFMRTCRSARNAIEGDGRSFWRRRFLATFEKPQRLKSNNEFKAMYLRRRLNNFHRVTFTKGNSRAEKECLNAIRDIIVDSYSGLGEGAAHASANMVHLDKIIGACPSLLGSIFDRGSARRSSHRQSEELANTNGLLQTIQALLTPHLLRLDSELSIWGFPDSQRAVYVWKKIWKTPCPVMQFEPEWLLHQVNFWRYHMLREDEITLCQAYCELNSSEYPGFWRKQLRNDGIPAIGRRWKGSYAYLEPEEVIEIRRHGNESGFIQDKFCGADESGLFQNLELELLEDGQETWPPIFEHHLGALAEPKKYATKTVRAQKRSVASDEVTWESRSFRFSGHGEDGEEGFLADGWLNTLPSQSGIPGWQRLTMMKYFADDNGDVDYGHGLWAYEGVVLPGGKIIVGRWWSPDGSDPVYSGPFILWCVDGDTPTPAKSEDDAMSQQL